MGAPAWWLKRVRWWAWYMAPARLPIIRWELSLLREAGCGWRPKPSPSGHQLVPSTSESLLPHRPVREEKNTEKRQAPERRRGCCLNSVHLDRAGKSPLSAAAALRCWSGGLGWPRAAARLGGAGRRGPGPGSRAYRLRLRRRSRPRRPAPPPPWPWRRGAGEGAAVRAGARANRAAEETETEGDAAASGELAPAGPERPEGRPRRGRCALGQGREVSPRDGRARGEGSAGGRLRAGPGQEPGGGSSRRARAARRGGAGGRCVRGWRRSRRPPLGGSGSAGLGWAPAERGARSARDRVCA